MKTKAEYIQSITNPCWDRFQLQINVLRLDLIDPDLSGNKYFKLKYIIQYAVEKNYKKLLSFGGAYSNHIHALALAGRRYGLETVGLIRGEEHQPLNPTLQDAVDAGMTLYYLSRSEYKRRQDNDYIEEIKARFPDCYIIPEGGSSVLGVKGCMDIAAYIPSATDIILLPCGTGATLAGIAAACPDKQVVGISVLKNAYYLESDIGNYMSNLGISDVGNWRVEHDFHCGGYAKAPDDLTVYIEDFVRAHQISIEPVYSGKLFYAVEKLITANVFSAGTNILVLHTGGLQGIRGMQEHFSEQLVITH